MGHGREHIERLAAGRRQARVGHGRLVQIEAEVRRELRPMKDLAQHLPVARAEQDRVVRSPWIAPAGSEVDHEQRHRPVHALQLFAPGLGRGSPR